MVSVYIEENPEQNSEEVYKGYSFDTKNIQTMKYRSEFLQEMSENPVGVAMQIHSSSLLRDLDYDIKLPEFYDGFSQYDGFEIT